MDAEGVPSRVFGTHYQFLSSGPGDLDCRTWGSCNKYLVDKGDDWPVMFDVPKTYTVGGVSYTPEGLRLAAFAEKATDTDPEAPKTIQVAGFDSDCREINIGANPAGEAIPINRWDLGIRGRVWGRWEREQWAMSTNYFSEVCRVWKPATDGTVTLYAVDTVNNYFFFLAEYHPSQLIPQFRRYSVMNRVGTERSNFLVQVKLRNLKLVNDTDILPIDSMQALKLMAMAISQENQLDVQGSLVLANQAMTIMGAREHSRTMTDGTPIIMNRNYPTSLGRALNTSRIL